MNEDKNMAGKVEVFDKTDNPGQSPATVHEKSIESIGIIARFFSNFLILGLELKRYLCYTIRVLRIDNAISILFIIRIIL